MPTNVLNLNDLDNLVRGFEQKYAATSVEMLQNNSVRDRVPEHDLLRWEAYVYHRVHLRELSESTHSKYLSQLEAGVDSEKHHVVSDQLDYAA
jgi:hypothetical protein